MSRILAVLPLCALISACAPIPEIGDRLPVTGPPPALLPIDQLLAEAGLADPSARQAASPSP